VLIKRLILFLRDSDDQKHDVTLQLCNMNIKRVNCSKYVGIYVDDQLNWKYDIEYVY